jgi:hypothetical protein
MVAGGASATGGVQGSPSGIGGVAGSAGGFVQGCEIQQLESDCRVGAVAELSCNARFDLSTAEQQGRTWLYLSEAPEGSSPLHAADCKKVEAYDVPEPPPGVLTRSHDELPYVVERTSDGLSLYRGLPADITREDVDVTGLVNLFVGPESVVWWKATTGTAGDVGLLELNEAASLSAAPNTLTHEGVLGMAPRLYLRQGVPVAVVFDGEQWSSVGTAGSAGLGTIHGGLDWSFEGKTPVSLTSDWFNPSDERWSTGISVSGVDPEFVAARLAAVYGLPSEEAERRANESLLSTEYLPAPVLELAGWEDFCTSPPASSCTVSTKASESDAGVAERADARVTHDSSGVPWLVAVRQVADSICRTMPTCTESTCSCPSFRLYRNSKFSLVLRRLALPEVDVEFELPAEGTHTLWVDGPVGSVVIDQASKVSRTVIVWRFDLDAL